MEALLDHPKVCHGQIHRTVSFIGHDHEAPSGRLVSHHMNPIEASIETQEMNQSACSYAVRASRRCLGQYDGN